MNVIKRNSSLLDKEGNEFNEGDVISIELENRAYFGVVRYGMYDDNEAYKDIKHYGWYVDFPNQNCESKTLPDIIYNDVVRIDKIPDMVKDIIKE